MSAAVIADAVTLLSNAWNDITSFATRTTSDRSRCRRRPTPPTCGRRRRPGTGWASSRQGHELPAAAGNATASDPTADFGHRRRRPQLPALPRGLGNGTLNYRGSIISLYTSRQAIGVYKCCNIVYGRPTRGYNFDAEFLTPNLLPPRTPMFRDVNTLTFRQVLRPTQ